MSSKVFLYRMRDTDDRDACAYIEKPGQFQCDYYFAGVNLEGSCYSTNQWPEYDEIETVLTKAEYTKLRDYDRAMHLLGYGIQRGDERYQAGVTLTNLVMPVWEKLNSDEATEFFQRIKDDEDEILMGEYGFDASDLETIFDHYSLDYHDRSVVGCVFEDAEELGEEEAYSFGYISRENSVIERYFDFEQFGRDLIEDHEGYVELPDGRVVYLNY